MMVSTNSLTSSLSDLTRESIEAFFGDRRQAGYKSHLTPLSLRPILQYLEAEGVVSIPEVLVTRNTVEAAPLQGLVKS